MVSLAISRGFPPARGWEQAAKMQVLSSQDVLEGKTGNLSASGGPTCPCKVRSKDKGARKREGASQPGQRGGETKEQILPVGIIVAPRPGKGTTET